MMTIHDIATYAQTHNIPMTAVKLHPHYDEKKRRVSKGNAIANKGWDKEAGFKKENLAYYGNEATAYFLLLSKANMFVIDVDVVGDTTAREALTEEAYQRLHESSVYEVVTGSGGLHFYYQSNGVKLTAQRPVKQWASWFRPGVEGAVDLITDYIMVAGSSYEYEGKTYRYQLMGNRTFSEVTFHKDMWDEVSRISTPKNEVVAPEVTVDHITPIQKEAWEVVTKKIKEVEQLVDLLSKERATGYDSWIKVGFVLKGLFYDGADGLELFKRFSAQSNKYNEGECAKAYRAIVPRKNGLTKKSLFHWAKQDSPAEFNEMFGFQMNWGSLKALNQNEMAKCFIGLVTQEFVFSEGVWYRYTENNTLVRMGKGHPDALKRQVSDTLQSEAFRMVTLLDKGSEVYTACLKLAAEAHKTFGSSQWINGVIDFIRGIYTDDELSGLIDTNMNLLAFSNGLLFDYGTKTIRRIEREDNVMKTTKKPLTQEKCEATRAWLMSELKNIFNEDDVVQYWLETIAMSLFRNKFEKLYCHTGSGGNGKGVLFGMIKEALGEYYYQAPNEFLTTTYKADAPNSVLANARGVRIFMTSEPSSENSDGRGMKLGTDLIKALTGGDEINVRDLYASANSPYVPTFTSFLQVNAIPNFTKIDGGLRRRFEKIDYPNKFVEEFTPGRKNEKARDDTLKEKMGAYQVINEFVLLLWDVAKGFTVFHRPASVKASTTVFLDDSDKVLCWITEKMERCDGLPKKEERITKADMLRMFIADTGVKMSQKVFHDQMAVNEVEYKKNGGKEYYCMRLKDAVAEDDE